MQSRRFSGLLLIGILAVIYFIAGKLGLMLASLHANASPVWPPAGIALAAILLLGYRAWPAIFVGAFLVNLTTAGDIATSVAIATGNTVEAVAGAWLVNCFAGGKNVFDRPQGVFKFALAAAISAVVSPLFGVTSLALDGFADWTNYGAIWVTWWLGDVTGDLIFTPLVLLWGIRWKLAWKKEEAVEVGVLLLLLALLSAVVFGGWLEISAKNYPIAFICGPIVIWTAFRFTQRETATGIFILSVIAVWGTVRGFGPFVGQSENQSLLTVQSWTAVLAITAMALSAGMAERRHIEEELQQQKSIVETANRTKDHFLASLSHELRTPLTPVISALESLETEPAQTEEDRSVEPKSDLQPEIAHLLSIDVAGYSKLSNNEQIELLQELNQIVRSTECFRSAEASGKLNRVPTGDGMALLFFRSPEEPVRCALEIGGALRDHPHIRLRMGVHSGPVNRITDVNDKTNFAGSGINVAQRVMDCGDAGHILLSAHVAEDLAQYRHWQPYLHDLGECEVKHGLRLHLFNLYKDGLGNPQVPGKLRRRRKWKQESDMVRPVSLPRRPRSLLVLALVVAALAMVISSLTFFQRVSLRMTPSTPREETGSKGTVLIPEKSIAILPFENLSGDKANAYFADGIHDEILMRLSKIADLKVISRTSTQHYKSAPENLNEIAKQLGVAHILEGSVQKSGDAVRVNVQLIKADDDSQVWAETFDRKLTDIFSVESDVAKAIADQLRAHITRREEQVIAAKPTKNIEAYDAYLRGRYFWNKRTSDGIKHAIEHFQQSIARDPDFALGHAGLADSYIALTFYNFAAPHETMPKAKESAIKALALDDPLAEGHASLAHILMNYDWNWPGAEKEFKRTVELKPDYATGHQWYAIHYLTDTGRFEEAVQEMKKALELEPASR